MSTMKAERRMNIVMMCCGPFQPAVPVRVFPPSQHAAMRRFMLEQEKRTPHAVLSVHNTPYNTTRPVVMAGGTK